MSVKEVVLGIQDGEEITARLVRQPLQERDLISLLVKNPSIPYLFLEIITLEGNKPFVMFGDARNHAEFGQAVGSSMVETAGKVEGGQLAINKDNKKIDNLILPRLSAYNVEYRKKQTNLVFDAINSNLLLPYVLVRYGNGAEGFYETASKDLHIL